MNSTTSQNKLNWISDIVVVLFVIIMLAIGYYMYPPNQKVKVIDCSLVEISPDFTPEVRDACRKARSGRI